MFKNIIITIFLLTTTLFSQTSQILLDENFSDWNNIAISYSDTQNDQASGSLDLGRLWISNDSEYLFIRFETGSEILLQEENNLTLFLDADNNPSTGTSFSGIGAEIKFNFGDKRGYFYATTGSSEIEHIDIGLISSPTVSSNQFELAIARNAQIGGIPLFNNSLNTLKVLLKDEGSGGDQLPNESGGVQYTFNNSIESLPSYSITKLSNNHIRVMTYNVENDGLLDDGSKQYFERIIKSIKPDIIGFEELSASSADQVKSRIEEFLPGSWYSSKPDYDRVLVSKYQIQSSGIIETIDYYPSDYFVLDAQQQYGVNILVIVTHPKCCNQIDNSGVSSDQKRQTQIDAIMSFIRKAKDGTGAVTIPQNTPIIVLGDMNFVGDSQQPTTLLTGDIQNNGGYGPDFTPDWDNTSFDDAKPITTGLPATFTNYSPIGDYSPGRLDYIVFTGAVMSLENSFALFTESLSQTELTQNGLLINDTENASDHIPVVADFEMGKVNSTEEEEQIPLGFRVEQNYPNPFNPSTRFNYYLLETSEVRILLSDALGKIIYTKDKGNQSSGKYTETINANEIGISSGVYFLIVDAETNNKMVTSAKKIVLLK